MIALAVQAVTAGLFLTGWVGGSMYVVDRFVRPRFKTSKGGETS